MASIAFSLSRPRPLIRALLSCAVLAFGLFVITSRTVYVYQIFFPMFTFSLATVLIFHACARRPWVDLVHVACLTLLFGAIAFLWMYLPYHWMAWLGFAGVSSFVVLSIRAIWADGEERKLCLFAVTSCVLLLALEAAAGLALRAAEPLFPRTLDLYLFSFDGSLGGQPSFWMGRAFAQWPLFAKTSIFFYNGLPLILALVCALQIRARSAKALPAVSAIILAGPIGLLFYSFFPALGPAHIPQLGFPWHPLAAAHATLAQVAARGPRNAIPSLHMTWVLLCWWYTRGFAWWARAAAFLFIVSTVFSTIGSGEHYVVDLIVAFPFALFIESLFSSLPWRAPAKLAALAWGLSAVFTWLLLLRFIPGIFWLTPVIPWAFAAITIAVSLWREARLGSLPPFANSL